MGLWSWLRDLLAPAPAPAPPTDEPDQPEPADPNAVVQVPIEDSFDLHMWSPRDVPSVVDEYLREARRAGFVEVRVIHGRGKGVQRQIVRRILEKHPDVETFADDQASRGGATLVRLRRGKGAKGQRDKG